MFRTFLRFLFIVSYCAGTAASAAAGNGFAETALRWREVAREVEAYRPAYDAHPAPDAPARKQALMSSAVIRAQGLAASEEDGAGGRPTRNWLRWVLTAAGYLLFLGGLVLLLRRRQSPTAPNPQRLSQPLSPPESADGTSFSGATTEGLPGLPLLATLSRAVDERFYRIVQDVPLSALLDASSAVEGSPGELRSIDFVVFEKGSERVVGALVITDDPSADPLVHALAGAGIRFLQQTPQQDYSVTELEKILLKTFGMVPKDLNLRFSF